MGGLGSGRIADSILAESCLSLDISLFTRNPGAHHRGYIQFSRGSAIAYEFDSRDLIAGGLTLSFVVPADRTPVRQRIEIEETYPHFGGRRLWFSCPSTLTRCRKVYYYDGFNGFYSRRALGLTYYSQRLDAVDRPILRQKRLLAKLDAQDTKSGEESKYLVKPKWMRWKTFYALKRQIHEAGAQSDECFAALYERLVGRL